MCYGVIYWLLRKSGGLFAGTSVGSSLGHCFDVTKKSGTKNRVTICSVFDDFLRSGALFKDESGFGRVAYKRGQRWCRGSLTVEASLVFLLVLYTVIFIIYSAFYLHNEMILQEAVYETAIYGTMLDKSDVGQMQTKMSQKYNEAVGGRLISMKQPGVCMEVKDNEITVSVQGRMDTVPIGFASNYHRDIICAEKTVSYSNPLDKIRILKLIENLNERK